MNIPDILNHLKNFFQPSVASITQDFHKAVTRLEAVADKLEEEVEAHIEAIHKHEDLIDAKLVEQASADAIVANIRNLMNVKEK